MTQVLLRRVGFLVPSVRVNQVFFIFQLLYVQNYKNYCFFLDIYMYMYNYTILCTIFFTESEHEKEPVKLKPFHRKLTSRLKHHKMKKCSVVMERVMSPDSEGKLSINYRKK